MIPEVRPWISILIGRSAKSPRITEHDWRRLVVLVVQEESLRQDVPDKSLTAIRVYSMTASS